MKIFRHFAQKYALVFSVVIILISLGILRLGDGGHIGVDLIISTLKGLLPAGLFSVAVMFLLGFARDGLHRHGTLRGFASGWLLLVIGVAYFLLQLLTADMSMAFEGLNAVVFAAILFDVFCTGLFEEALMRGVVFYNMRNAWSERKNGIMTAAIVSSAMFGLMHLANYSDGMIVATASQVFYTTFIGIFLCGIYIKSGYNLWSVILLHAVFDFFTLFLQFDYMYTEDIASGSPQDLPLIMGLITIAATLPLCIAGIRYIKQGLSPRFNILRMAGREDKHFR